jgi:hypothetical protein
MNIQRCLTACGLVAMMAAPVASNAGGNPERALDACVQSFVATYLPNRVVHVQKRLGATSPLAIYERTLTIAITARGARSGEPIAQARCVASARGDVLVIDNPPLETYLASADFTANLR